MIAAPELVHGWGPQTKRLFLHGGITPEFLHASAAELAPSGPPGLLAGLCALSADLGGGFRESPVLLFSSVFFLGILVAAREVLSRATASSATASSATASSAGTPGDAQRLTLAILGFSLAAFGIGYPLAGSAHWLTALVRGAALPALLARSVC